MAAYFPTVEEIFSLMFQELPAGVYAQDRANNANPNSNSTSSAELRAHAQMFANLYANLEVIYYDKFITTVSPAGLARWESDLFSTPPNIVGLTYAQRQANLLTQFRTEGSISYPTINAIIEGILGPQGLSYQLIQWNGNGPGVGGNPGITGGWILDVSILDVGTWLAALDPLRGAGRGVGIVPLDCSLNYAAAGLTEQDLIDIQTTAYTYEVQIFGNASAATLAQLNAALTAKEPARSTHVITNNATPPIGP